jgi:hypothetical protein
MVPLVFFVTALAVSAHAHARDDIVHARQNAPETLSVAPFTLPLTDKITPPAFKTELRNALHGLEPSTAVLGGVSQDMDYAINITVGGQNFKVIVDTGS